MDKFAPSTLKLFQTHSDKITEIRSRCCRVARDRRRDFRAKLDARRVVLQQETDLQYFPHKWSDGTAILRCFSPTPLQADQRIEAVEIRQQPPGQCQKFLRLSVKQSLPQLIQRISVYLNQLCIG